MDESIGLIGLGNAGLALATPLAGRLRVVGYDKNEARRELARAAGVEIADSVKAVAQAASIVVLSLPNPAISRAVLAEIGAEALKDRIIVETSTVSPKDIESLVSITAPAQAEIVEAAIVGGVHKLAAGQGTFLIGASERNYARIKPVFDIAAEEIFYLGPLGNAMQAKLVVNAVAHATMVVLLEAAALAAAQGIPMKTFYELMRRDSGLTRPLTHRFGERILQQDFEGGMPTANAHKDSALALELAHKLGVPLFAISASHTPYEIAMREGLERQDYASLAKLWEKWVGVRFAD